jgi:hypothetical protein
MSTLTLFLLYFSYFSLKAHPCHVPPFARLAHA